MSERTTMRRQLVMLKVHDADAKEHVFGPIEVEMEKVDFAAFANPYDAYTKMDKLAFAYLLPDMSCDCLAGELAHVK